MAKTEKVDPKAKCRIVTPTFRVSYPHVFKPAQVMGKGEFKYSITMLFKKDADLTSVKEAIRNAKIAQFGPNKADWPELDSPVMDGDSPKYADKEGYKGHWAIKAISNENVKPGVVDYPAGDPILEQSDFYPGCYARAQVFARVWEFSGKQGIHFILDHVQKLKDGKPFSSKKSAKEAFGATAVDDEDDSVDGDDNDSDGDDDTTSDSWGSKSTGKRQANDFR